jgi:pyruvate,water dikinase
MTIATRETEQAGAPAAPTSGFWQREASHNPRPLTPMGSSIFIEGVNPAFEKVFDEFGLLLARLEFREIRGYVYACAVPYGPAGSGSRTPPKPLLWLALRMHPMLRKRIAVCERAVRERRDKQLLSRWYDEWRPQLIKEIDDLRALDLRSMTDRELAAHFDELLTWVFSAFDKHFMLTGAYGLPLARLIFFCRDYLGYDDMQSLRLMSGTSSTSSEPALALAALADRIRAHDAAARAVLAASPADVRAALQESDAELTAAYDAYIRTYAFRALRYEVVEPAMDEQPALIGQLLRDQLQHPSDLATEQQQLAKERDEAKAAALALLADDAQRAEFTSLLEDAALAYGVREDNEFFTVSVPFALCRVAALEAARRLVAADRIAIEDDVFFLRWNEAAAALRGEGGADEWAELVEQRRALHATAEAFDAPASYGVEPPPPPLDVLPPGAREAMEAVLYMQVRVFEAERSQERAAPGTKEISGRAAARGTYTGTARVIMGEHEFDRLQRGDVLVCPITSPVWSILFAKVGALVTDSGGILSHPAIIAREYGIPAVVATGNATSLIADGQRVTVDGDAGIVRILD